MIVAYDLRYATDHFPGIGTHAWELLHALLDLPGAERYRVLWNPRAAATRFDVAPVRAHARVEWHERASEPLRWNTPRETGAWLRDVGGDVFLSPFSLLPQRPGRPVAVTLHDVLPLAREGGATWWRRWRFAQAMRATARADAVLTSSEFSCGEIARLTRIPPGHVHVVPLGVTAAPQGEPRRPAAAPDGPFALTVGANRPHKNHAILAAAWRAMGPDPPLALVAVGPDDPRFPGWRTPGRDAPGILPLGRVPQAELEWLYRHATLVLHPSRYEGFGFPLLEAASRGAPVVCSDIPALRELGQGAVRFVAADDVQGWVDAVRSLAADADGRSRLAAAGRELAAQHGYARCAEATLAILRTLVTGAR